MADGSNTKPTIRERLRYRFDNILARGTWAVLAWLGIITLIVVLLASFSLRRVGVELSGSTNRGWFEDFWQSLLRTLDTGTMAGDTGFRPRLVALLVTLFGLLVAGTVIGVIASGVEAQIDRMKRGRSTVIESDHVVVLGASMLLPDVVDQLVLANGLRRTAVVVLTDRDPSEVSDEVRQVVGGGHRTRLVFRAGDPTRIDDLELVGIREARSIVVLNGDGDSVGDARAAHTVQAVRDLVGDTDAAPIVVALDDARIAQVMSETYGSSVHPIVSALAVARMAAFTLRASGLGDVMELLTDFDGADLYVTGVPGSLGRSYGELATGLVDVRLVGRLGPDGGVELNPPTDAVIGAGDRLVLIADDGGTPALSHRDVDAGPATPSATQSSATQSAVTQSSATQSAATRSAATRLEFHLERREEHLLVIGWNSIGPQLLAGWAMTAAPSSTVEILFDERLVDESEIAVPALGIGSVTVTPADGGTLAIDPSTMARATTITLLSYRDRLPITETDSRTLLDLLTLRRGLLATASRPRLVVELLDGGNRTLAKMDDVDDLIVSPEMTSRLIAQLADQPERRAVLLQMYATEGPSIRLVPAARLGLVGSQRTGDVVRTGLEHGVSPIGWRRHGVTTINPHDGVTIELAPDDEIVVIG